MILRNFALEKGSHAIALEGLGRYWDLHAFARLESLRYVMADNVAELTWKVQQIENPWGDRTNTATGCLLRFNNVGVLKVMQGDDQATREDQCVSSISQIDKREHPLSEPVEFRMRREWKSGDEFGLLIILQSGRTIEIQAESADLIALR
jgi:hypothetical protein